MRLVIVCLLFNPYHYGVLTLPKVGGIARKNGRGTVTTMGAVVDTFDHIFYFSA